MRELRHAVCVLLTLAAIFFIAPGLLVIDRPMPDDGHGTRALDLAFTRAQCRNGYSAHRSFSIAAFLRTHPEMRYAPMRDIARDQRGSIEQYCAETGAAAMNNENALSFIEWAAIRVSPTVSLAGLGERLHLVRVLLLAFTAFAFLAAGAGLVASLAMLPAALGLLKFIEGAVYSLYPFLFVLIASVVGVYALCAAYARRLEPAGRLAMMFVAGAIAAIGVNTRTSHAPVYVALLILGPFAVEWLAAGEPRLGRAPTTRSMARRTAWAVAAGAIGFAVIHVGVMGLFLRGAVAAGSSAHSLAHPLVLSIALPRNALSEREGIEWDDRTGLDIARRFDPAVEYLSPRYERLLLEYYASLWRKHPREMLRLYVTKLQIAGSDVYAKLVRHPEGFGPWAKVFLWPFGIVRSGLGVLALYVSAFLVSLVVIVRWRTAAAVPIALCSAAAALLHVEAAMITPDFFLPYHNFTGFYAIVFSLAVLQLIVSGVTRLVVAWPRGERPAYHVAIGVARELFLYQRPRGVARSLLYVAVVAGAAAVVRPSFFGTERVVMDDGHALASLELAIARAMCGTPSAFSPSIRIPYEVRDQPDLRIVPIRSLLVQRAGSIDAYCATVTVPFVNNENSLMLLDSWILRLRPRISVAGLAKAMHVIRIGGIFLFAFLLFTLGSSLVLTFGTVLSSLFFLHLMARHVHSVYPFLFVLVVVIVAAYTFALKYRSAGDRLGVAAVGAVAGMYSAFAVNLRSSYLPVYVALFVLFLCAGLLQMDGATLRRRVTRAGQTAMCFAAGYVLFQWGLITRHQPGELRRNSAHSVAHPLVLGLGVPQNDLSRREGIDWIDEAGATLAKREMPGARYLGPNYDEALFRYYGRLWRTYPREMLRIYVDKAKLAGMPMIEILRGFPGWTGRLARVLLLPLSRLPNGLWVLALYAAAAVAGAYAYTRRHSLAGFALALLATTATLLQIESSAIMPFFVINYHNYLAFFAVFVSMLAYQLAANVLWTVASRAGKASGSRGPGRPGGAGRPGGEGGEGNLPPYPAHPPHQADPAHQPYQTHPTRGIAS